MNQNGRNEMSHYPPTFAVISSHIFSSTFIFEPFKPEAYPTFGSELSQSLSQNLGGAFVPLNGHEDVWVHGPVAYDGRLSFFLYIVKFNFYFIFI